MQNPMNFIKQLEGSHATECLLNLLKNGSHQRPSRINTGYIPASEIGENLPTCFSKLTEGLSNPSVKIRGKFTGSSNIAGFTVTSEGKPVENIVVSLSEDSSVFQQRRQVFDKEGRIFSEYVFGDTKQELNNRSRSITDINPEYNVITSSIKNGNALKYDAELNLAAKPENAYQFLDAPDEVYIYNMPNAMGFAFGINKMFNNINPKRLLADLEPLVNKQKGLEAKLAEINPNWHKDSMLRETLTRVNTTIAENLETKLPLKEKMLLLERKKAILDILKLKKKIDPANNTKYAEQIERIKAEIEQKENKIGAINSERLKAMTNKRIAGFKLSEMSEKEKEIYNELKILEKKDLRPLQHVEEAKNIIAKKLNIDPNLIKIRKCLSEALSGKDAAFNGSTGELFVTDSLLMYNPKIINGLIRHELAHAEDFLKLYKAIGTEKYKELLKSFGKSERFDKNLFDKLSRNLDIKDFDVEKYSEAMKNYNMKNTAQYYTNAFEERAYELMAHYDNTFKSQIYACRYYQDIIKKIKNPEEITNLQKKAIDEINEEYIGLNITNTEAELMILERMLSILERTNNACA